MDKSPVHIAYRVRKTKEQNMSQINESIVKKIKN